ncbi:Protein of unknown function [Gryllus bimaculatus]|nr:Protein of unknown function [Gryllus bimaculatus]
MQPAVRLRRAGWAVAFSRLARRRQAGPTQAIALASLRPLLPSPHNPQPRSAYANARLGARVSYLKRSWGQGDIVRCGPGAVWIVVREVKRNRRRMTVVVGGVGKALRAEYHPSFSGVLSEESRIAKANSSGEVSYSPNWNIHDGVFHPRCTLVSPSPNDSSTCGRAAIQVYTSRIRAPEGKGDVGEGRKAAMRCWEPPPPSFIRTRVYQGTLNEVCESRVEMSVCLTRCRRGRMYAFCLDYFSLLCPTYLFLDNAQQRSEYWPLHRGLTNTSSTCLLPLHSPPISRQSARRAASRQQPQRRRRGPARVLATLRSPARAAAAAAILAGRRAVATAAAAAAIATAPAPRLLVRARPYARTLLLPAAGSREEQTTLDTTSPAAAADRRRQQTTVNKQATNVNRPPTFDCSTRLPRLHPSAQQPAVFPTLRKDCTRYPRAVISPGNSNARDVTVSLYNAALPHRCRLPPPQSPPPSPPLHTSAVDPQPPPPPPPSLQSRPSGNDSPARVPVPRRPQTHIPLIHLKLCIFSTFGFIKRSVVLKEEVELFDGYFLTEPHLRGAPQAVKSAPRVPAERESPAVAAARVDFPVGVWRGGFGQRAGAGAALALHNELSRPARPAPNAPRFARNARTPHTSLAPSLARSHRPQPTTTHRLGIRCLPPTFTHSLPSQNIMSQRFLKNDRSDTFSTFTMQ